MTTLIESKWKCPDCYEIHDSEDAAMDCCPRSVREVYLCPHCEDFYYSLKEATECRDLHDEENEDFVPPPATAAELEAVGQARLPL